MLAAGFLMIGVSFSTSAQETSPQAAFNEGDLAYELAKAWAPSILVGLLDIGLVADAEFLEQKLLASHWAPRGTPCDPSLDACKAAARKAAREHAERVEKFRRKISTEALANHIRNSMSAEQMAASLAFVRTDTGQRFSATLNSVPGPSYLDAYHRLRGSGAIIDAPENADMFNAFYDIAEGLPRAPLRAIPPPPMPPSQSRSNPEAGSND